MNLHQILAAPITEIRRKRLSLTINKLRGFHSDGTLQRAPALRLLKNNVRDFTRDNVESLAIAILDLIIAE